MIIKSYKNKNGNLLLQGDCYDVCKSLLNTHKDRIDLIYIDPPFGDNKCDKPFGLRWDKVNPLQDLNTAIQHKDCLEALSDTSYLQWIAKRLILMRELLSPRGSIYVHCDWHCGHYIKVLMDCIFGRENFRNEIVWGYKRWSAPSKSLQKMHDVIYFYSKTDSYIFNKIYADFSNTRAKFSSGYNTNTIRQANGAKIRQIIVENEELFEASVKLGKIKINENDKIVYKNNQQGTLESDFWNLPILNPQAKERTNYTTQKPEALLERIIKMGSFGSEHLGNEGLETNEPSIVADFFCGSGTTLAVAHKLGRRFIGSDMGKPAIMITRKRLLDVGAEFALKSIGEYSKKTKHS